MKYRVNIDLANRTKTGFSDVLDGQDERVLNRVGAFASLFRLDVRGYSEPVLVLKTEEPGSKQLLAFEHDRVESVCFDMINHLINDCIVMGAQPLAVQDLIVCGKLDPEIVRRIVTTCCNAASAHGCVLSGGETSEQPGVLAEGRYILGSSIVGLVERSRVVDGRQIKPGDQVIAVASSGPHTNGYTLICDLLKQTPSLADERVGTTTFIDAVLEPHRCYYQAVKGLLPRQLVSGMAHITGGGLRDNLKRILPDHVDAHIDLGLYRVPEVFGVIRQAAAASDEEMLRTFNLGVGLVIVCPSENATAVTSHLRAEGEHAFLVGAVVSGSGKVECHGLPKFGAA